MPAQKSPFRLGLFLVDGFSLMSYASVIEPFRAANVLAGQGLFTWSHITLHGGTARASNGAALLADEAVGKSTGYDMVFVFAAGDPASFTHAPSFAWLRALARAGVTVAGISGGPFLLARAGLLEGYRATIHWDHQPAFLEAFPEAAFEPGLYVIDRKRITCAGGTAGLDLAIEIIARRHGHALAAQVSDWFIRTDPRQAHGAQRLSLRERTGVADDRLLKMLAAMEADIEEPLSLPKLAARAGLSQRQLQRLCKTHLRCTVQAKYLEIRLEKAAHLLRKTGMSITAIALACGFGSGTHFARAFRTRFGTAPGAARRPYLP